MDKYEYNLKLEEIDKLVDQGAYEQAADVADAVDWRRVRNVRTLCLISEIYEAAAVWKTANIFWSAPTKNHRSGKMFYTDW